MAIRANKFLKFFAITLFMLEFLAPALPFADRTPTEPFNKISLDSSSTHSVIFLALFAEQLNENEEGRENYKSPLPFIDSYFDFSKPYHTYFLSVVSSQIENITHSFSGRPLFRLHCTYLI